MKSVFMSFMADLGMWLRLLFFWGWALLAGFVAWRLARARKPLYAVPLALLALYLLWLPFESRVAGRMLAENLCREIGGAHAHVALPVRVDSIAYPSDRRINPFLLSELLQQDGYAFVEHSTKVGGEVMAYRIEPTDLGRCSFDEVGGFSSAFYYPYFHEHGMRADECIAHTRQAKSAAAVTYSYIEEAISSPVPVTIRQDRYTNTATGSPLWTHKSFIYYPVNPRSSNGIKQAVHCGIDVDVPRNVTAERRSVVEGNGVARRCAALAERCR